MQICEVETKTGITRQNIRFYEKKGLLCPGRNEENHYRDYTDDDVALLLQIKILRRLNLPIEDIRRILNGEETETKDYPVEFINYGLNEDKSITDITYAENTSLGDTSTDKKMLIVKYHGNLTINEGVTVTATNVGNYTYKKGMYICVLRRPNQ